MAKCWTAHAVYEYSEIKRPPHFLLCLIPLEPVSLPLSCKAFPVGYLYSLGPHPPADTVIKGLIKGSILGKPVWYWGSIF